MLTVSSTLFLAAAVAALPAAGLPPQLPLYYGNEGYPRIQTNISWGSPVQAPIPAIFDTGSIGFWTYDVGAIVNDGSQDLLVLGNCNKTVTKAYNYRKSTTAAGLKNLTAPEVYSYGGNSKIIVAYQLVNDTMNSGKLSWNDITDVQVAIANFTLLRESDPQCTLDVSRDIDQSILGVGPFGVGDTIASKTGPSFRTNLLSQGKITANIMTTWMNKAPKEVYGIFQGTALFGQHLPKHAYSGELVAIKQSPPDDGYVGYYSALPIFTVGGQKISSVDNSVTNCLIDSGTGQDQLPFNITEVAKYSNVFEYSAPGGFLYQVYNSSCEAIPQNATFDFTFPGATQGQNAVVKVPIRNYARVGDPALPKDLCPLQLYMSNYGYCTFGAPFFTGVAMEFDDDKKTVSFAQGGVA